MHDLRFIRQYPDLFDKALEKRGKKPKSERILVLDIEYRQALTKVQELQNERNQLAKKFAEAKRINGATEELSKKAEKVKAEIAVLEETTHSIKQKLDRILSEIPNMIAEDVPEGKSADDNVVIRVVKEPKPFSFPPKQHFELGEQLSQMDFERASKLSGARFVVLKGHLAQLERALAHFMLDIHVKEFGYLEVSPPYMVNDQTVYGTGLLPKFKDDLFQTTRGDWLIPTAEVVLTNLVAGTILTEEELPLRFTAYTPCFRSEAGAAGRDTRGMIRQHQFSKVELVSITTSKQSVQEHERMTQAAEEVLKRLDLPYRVVLLCSGDIGFQSAKTYDLEVWLPGQNSYREISSCSNCHDFQARRMNTKYRLKSISMKPQTEFVHTLNGSGLAVGRTLIAVLENYQQDDGSIRIPEALIPYMDGLKVLR